MAPETVAARRTEQKTNVEEIRMTLEGAVVRAYLRGNGGVIVAGGGKFAPLRMETTVGSVEEALEWAKPWADAYMLQQEQQGVTGGVEQPVLEVVHTIRIGAGSGQSPVAA
jgi:hypothetical protein